MECNPKIHLVNHPKSYLSDFNLGCLIINLNCDDGVINGNPMICSGQNNALSLDSMQTRTKLFHGGMYYVARMDSKHDIRPQNSQGHYHPMVYQS